MEIPSHIGAFMLVLALASIVLGVSTSGSEAFPESSSAVINRRPTTSAELKGDIEDLDVAEQNYGNGGGYGNRPYGNNGGRGKGAHVTLNGPFGSYVAAGIGGDKGGNNGGGGGGGIFGNGGGIFGNNGYGGGIFGNNGNGAGYYGNNGYGNGGGYYGNNGAGRPGFFNRFFGR